MPVPCRTLSLTDATARVMTTLPDVSPTMSRVVRIGTPACMSVDEVAREPASATFWNSLPNTGIRNFSGSTTLRARAAMFLLRRYQTDENRWRTPGTGTKNTGS